MAITVDLKLSDQATRVYNQFVGNVNKQAATMDNTIKSIGTAVGAAFSVGAIAMFMKTAADANLQLARLDQSLANTGLTEYKEELLAASDALSEKTAVDGDEIVKLQAQLAAYTGNIAAVRQLTPAILDLAAGTGMTVEQAGKLVARTQEGSEGLKRLGIDIGKTTTEEERLAKITAEVTRRYGGMAEAFGNTDAGGLQKLSNAMEDLEETAGNLFLKILKPVLPGIIWSFEAIGWTIDKMFGGLKVGVAMIMTAIVIPLARVEEALNAMGITSSRVLQNFRDTGVRLVGEYSREVVNGTATAATSMKAVAITVTEVVDATKKFGDPKTLAGMGMMTAATKKLTEGYKAQAVVVKEELGTAYDYVQQQITDSWKTAEESAFSSTEIINGLMNSIRTTVQSAFNGDEAIGKNLFKSLLNTAINFAEAYIGIATSLAWSKGVSTFGISIPADLAIISAATVALEVARNRINKFHEGGTVGSMGQRIPLASDERPAILRVGETVRTVQQERALQSAGGGGGTVINLNFNHPVNGEEFIRQGAESLMRKLGVTDITKIFVNQRSNLSIA